MPSIKPFMLKLFNSCLRKHLNIKCIRKAMTKAKISIKQINSIVILDYIGNNIIMFLGFSYKLYLNQLKNTLKITFLFYIIVICFLNPELKSFLHLNYKKKK